MVGIALDRVTDVATIGVELRTIGGIVGARTGTWCRRACRGSFRRRSRSGSLKFVSGVPVQVDGKVDSRGSLSSRQESLEIAGSRRVSIANTVRGGIANGDAANERAGASTAKVASVVIG